MKRNPSRLLEKKSPANDWTRSGARPVSYVLMNNTTDMQSVSRTRHKSAQISAISQNATGQCAQAAAGAPPRGSVAPGWKQAPLVLMRNYEPLSKIPWRDGWNASRSSQLPETSSPIPELQNACVFAPTTRTCRCGSPRTTRQQATAGCRPAGASGRVLSVGLRWSEAQGRDTASNGYASRLWRRGASFDPHGSPYPL